MISDDDFIRHGDLYDQLRYDPDDELQLCPECNEMIPPEDWDYEEEMCRECFKPSNHR